MVEVIVEHAYTAKQDDELTIKVGNIITDVEKTEDGWWQGTLNGKTGVFPDNFVKELAPSSKEKARKTRGVRTNVTADGGSGGGSGGGMHVAELANKLGKEGAIRMGPNIMKRDKSEGGRKQWAKAMYSYTPVNEDELALTVGCMIEILSQADEGWWEGVIDGNHGVFPSNFVSLVDGPQPEEKIVHAKKVKGVGLGNIFGGGPMALRTTSAVEDSETASSSEPSVTPTSAEPTEPASMKQEEEKTTKSKEPIKKVPRSTSKDVPECKRPIVRAQVLYSYSAENSDELSLEVGEVVRVIDMDVEDSGWWKGELNGEEGLFPDNFVKILPAEKIQKPKKPPPPTVNPSTKSKPQKSVPEIEKESVEEKPAKSSPSKSSPTRPSPISKKPTDVKLIAQTDDHKAKKHGYSAEKIDIVTTESVKPVKQPTEVLKNEFDMEMTRRDRVESPELPAKGEVLTEKRATRPPPPLPKTATKPLVEVNNVVPMPTPEPMVNSRPLVSPVSSPPVVPLPPTPPTGASRPETTGLAKTTPHSELQSCGEPRPPAASLQQKLNEMQTQMADMKKHFDKRIKQLMDEVDEEKKTRMMMQVEIDRIRKLISS